MSIVATPLQNELVSFQVFAFRAVFPERAERVVEELPVCFFHKNARFKKRVDITDMIRSSGHGWAVKGGVTCIAESGRGDIKFTPTGRFAGMANFWQIQIGQDSRFFPRVSLQAPAINATKTICL